MRTGIWSLAALGFCWSAVAEAATLRVSPVLLDLQASRSSATLQLRNDADHALNVQVRIFRWSQKDGVDQYEPTRAVVVSPPATRLAPHVDYTVRIVRTSKAPIATEESYRLIIDEIPTDLVRRSGTVNLVMRHSIPVFFRAQRPSPPKMSWTLARDGDKIKLIVENAGGTRLRLSDLSLSQGNATAYRRKGLVGYVLAGSRAAWTMPIGKRATGSDLALKAESQLGPVNAIVPFVGR